MNRKDFQQLTELRVREAEMLRQAGHLEGAYYLLGYAVECALKACYCKRIAEHDFPDKRAVEKAYTHDLKRLLDISGVEADFATAAGANTATGVKWKSVTDWSEHSRYAVSMDPVVVDEFVAAVLDPKDGVLTWLKTQW